ncbi:expressed unknown protein [Seminavis robusta]|uniref:Uncharacterized protein n=1 Tax=Seminavis robusta TaxID=568900 RepID=A0A9N8DX41_9STRA|nr:expressed unknown protein [Seminavis robusta]|eukprot:Sro419_g139130.1 n/a (244) ;mRNA; f:43729-44460
MPPSEAINNERHECAACSADTSYPAKCYRCQAKECLQAVPCCIDLCLNCYPKRDSLNLPKPHEKTHKLLCIDPAAEEKFKDEIDRLCFRKGQLDPLEKKARVDLINTDRNFGDYISNALETGSIQVGVEYEANEFFKLLECRVVYFKDHGPDGRIVWNFDDYDNASWESAQSWSFEGLIESQNMWYPFRNGRMEIDGDKRYEEYPDSLKLGFRGCMVRQSEIATLGKIRVAREGPYAFGVFLN